MQEKITPHQWISVMNCKSIKNWLVLAIAPLVLLSFTFSSAFGQAFTAAVNKNKVNVGEPFQIEFTINEAASNFTAPAAMKDFDLLSGPNHSQAYQIINGRMSQSESISYVIAAKKEGKITIGPATIIVNGKPKQSNSIVIEIVKGGAGSANNGQQGGGQGGAQSGNPGNGGNAGNNPQNVKAQPGDENLFTRVSVSRTKVFQGEQIMVTYKVYTKLDLREIPNIKFPSFNGFWSQELQSKWKLSNEIVDGVNYTVAENKKTIIFPQRSGTIEIEPMEVTCILRQRSSRRQQSIFDQFFGNGGFEDVMVKTKSKPIKIEVLPLPEANKPASFSGAVGKFSLKITTNKNKVKTNEGVDLIATISGSGNLKLIDPLQFSIPPDLEKYDPKTVDNISTTADGVSGSKSFDYLMIPRNAGSFKIDPIEFSYFDTDKKNYVTLHGPELNIEVEKGKDDNNANITTNNASFSKDVVLLGNDIRFIKPKVTLELKKEEGFFGSIGFVSLCALPFLFWGGAFYYKRKRAIDWADGGIKLRNKSANRIANQRLALANKHKKAQNNEAFFTEILLATNGYLSDKLNIPVANLNKENIANYLQTHGVDNPTWERLNGLLERCEFAKYAPTAMAGDVESTFTDAQAIIADLESQLKKN